MNRDQVPLETLSHKSFGQLEGNLKTCGMNILGGFHLDRVEAANFANSSCSIAGLVVASHGRAMWRCFQQSSYYGDERPDPLDRWTKSVLSDLAVKTGTGLALPFNRPFPPFQQWARRATGISNSPLGILMHPEYGLWFGLRGVFFFKVEEEKQDVNQLIDLHLSDEKLCDKCIEKPCLSHCPVNAFTDKGLNVQACYSHLKSIQKFGSKPDCRSGGCVARAACPVATGHKYCDEQLQFHMNSYYSATS